MIDKNKPSCSTIMDREAASGPDPDYPVCSVCTLYGRLTTHDHQRPPMPGYGIYLLSTFDRTILSTLIIIIFGLIHIVTKQQLIL
jgi:hypothetical protein